MLEKTFEKAKKGEITLYFFKKGKIYKIKCLELENFIEDFFNNYKNLYWNENGKINSLIYNDENIFYKIIDDSNYWY